MMCAGPQGRRDNATLAPPERNVIGTVYATFQLDLHARIASRFNAIKPTMHCSFAKVLPREERLSVRVILGTSV